MYVYVCVQHRFNAGSGPLAEAYLIEITAGGPSDTSPCFSRIPRLFSTPSDAPRRSRKFSIQGIVRKKKVKCTIVRILLVDPQWISVLLSEKRTF